MKSYKYLDAYHLDKMESYFRQMHQAGYALKNIGMMGKLTFEACKAEDVVYRFDLQKQAAMDLNKAYIQTYQDAGWALVPIDYQGVILFKKGAAGIDNPSELEIYNDDASRFEYEKLLLRRSLTPGIVSLIAPGMQIYISLINNERHGALWWGLWGVILLLELLWLLYYWKKLRDLKKSYLSRS
ncbi:DUF2812 domain-containing protein [Streptococcus loxodontisalivarius]|uniref:DUF2812 domain-containing protein n=1 Tax=Streptococcus loxodontisalivarius TaxID=1349415 RepID=A0ABS2PTB0_9STRE|nr:DUF2812 domain-containing protein [Streptococcus loxodontisalivarius]MBM7643269.1 hypothetical protein [Streptococcus loxodontisalivarius]